MRKILPTLLLSVCFGQTCLGQIRPTASGSVLTYEVFSAKQQRYQKDISFQANQDLRVLQLNLGANGARTYTFMNDKPYAVYDKNLAMLALLGKTVDTDARYPLLPTHQKIEAGMQWDFLRKGLASACGNWTVAHHALAKDGPETALEIDGQHVVLKTLLIEFQGAAKSDRCDPYQQERFALYAPELHELLLDQWIDYTPDGMTSDHGYKWVLKTVTTSARQAPK
jgi:hypothetical protein